MNLSLGKQPSECDDTTLSRRAMLSLSAVGLTTIAGCTGGGDGGGDTPTPESPGVHGKVTSAAGTDLAGYTIAAVGFKELEPGPESKPEFSHGKITEGGRFSVSNLFEPPYFLILTIETVNGGYNDVVPLYDLVVRKRIDQEKTILGSYTIPESYQTQVQFVDGSENPVSDFSAVNLRTQGGQGAGPRTYTTTDDGYLIAEGASKPGVAVPPEGKGDLTVTARPSDGGRMEKFGTIYGSERNKSFKFTISDPARFS